MTTDFEALIASSAIFKAVSTGRSDIEIWDDAGFVDEDGRSYFSIVSRSDGVVRKLKYLRVKDSIIEDRTYDDDGEEVWVIVE